jgi:hypothetical protein
LSSKLAMIAVPLFVAYAAAARAADEDGAPEDAPPEDAPPERAEPPATNAPIDDAAAGANIPDFGGAAAYYPPPVDGPALRLPESPTRLYLDGTYMMSDDLSALPYIAGTGRNYRAALGGAWRWRRFTVDGQLPVHVSTLSATSFLNMAPSEEDAEQTTVSLGDLALGATWTERLAGEGLIGGVGVRGRLATHTTRFQFHLADGTLADFVLPYYFHIEPTLILGGAIGRFTYVLNQGAIVLLGPDGDFDTEHITVPSIYLWDAHYAVGYAPWSFLGASVELATTIQLNHVGGADFQKFNDIRAVWVAPALQIHGGATRVDLIARFGLSQGQELYGVIEHVLTHSFTLRVTQYFD